MYDLGPAFGNRTVDPGTNVLVSGPPLSGVRRIAFEAVAHGVSHNNTALVITTRYGADRVLADLDELLDTENATVGIIDCVTRRQDRRHGDDSRVKYVASPAALTRIGIKFSELLTQFHTRNTDGTRVLVDSLSTLLPYGQTQSVFRFVHALGGQIDEAGAVGLHVIEPSAHDDETYHTIQKLFDDRVTVENNAVVGLDIG